MSEYQYYEFQSIDRPLCDREMEEISRLSSRVDLTPHRAVFTYSHGDFRGDPVKVLEKHFDAMLYLANWGSRWLYFRLPNSIVTSKMLTPYCVEDIITVSTKSEHTVVGICFHEVEPAGWIEGEGWVSSLIPLREQLLQGDYRALYLAWLKAVQFLDDTDDRREPPVPAGLRDLPSALHRFIEFFDIDTDLVQVAAEASQHAEAESELEWTKWIPELSQSEQVDFLTRLARGESNVGVQLRAKLKEIFNARKPSSTKSTIAPPRHRSEILGRAEALAQLRDEKERQAAQEAHVRKMKNLAKQESSLWGKVTKLVDQKQIKAYDEAVTILRELSALAEHRGASDAFQARVDQIHAQHRRLSGLHWRLIQAGLLQN